MVALFVCLLYSVSTVSYRVSFGGCMDINAAEKAILANALVTELARFRRAYNAEKVNGIKEILIQQIADVKSVLDRVESL